MRKKSRFTLVMMAVLLMFGMLGIQPVEPVQAALASDLFFSEYLEGTDGSEINRAIEIYNGTGAPVDLSGYRLELYSNGAASPTATAVLSGTLLAGDVFVAAHGSATQYILDQADLTNSLVINFNGDDAFALRKISTDLFTDVIGQIGDRPTSGYWGSNPAQTANRTLVRKAEICAGDIDGSDAFVPSTEWVPYPTDTISYLGWHTSNCVLNESEALLWLQDNTALTGTLDALVATFPASIPPVIDEADYVIDSRITFDAALPAGTMISVTRDGTAYVSDLELTGAGPFWLTDLIPGASRAAFDAATYDGQIENYVITMTGPGTNHLDFDTDVKIESVILKGTVETVLADIELPVNIPADEAAALTWLQENTTLTGTLDALVATFPGSIPPVIVAEDYVIDSRISLSEALPEGVTVTVYKDGVAVLSDITLSGVGPFWFTELFTPDPAPRADFDANYGTKVEEYSIILNGAVAFDYSSIVTVESVISKDDFTTETVLDDIELAASIAATEAEALAFVIEKTVLSSVSGTIDDLKATFPESIPPLISDGNYVIDSRITLADPLPAGTTVTVYKNGAPVLSDITLDGTGPFLFTTLFDPDQTQENFDDSIYGGTVEDYVIELTGPGDNPLDFDTTVMIESVLFKFGLATGIVLDGITLDAHIDDGVAPVMEDVAPAEGALLFGPEDTLVLTVDAADLNLYELEIDHSMAASLPEFSVYADALNPWGTLEDKAQFDAAGVTVAYDDVEQVWTIDFGADITDAFIANGGITFYMVLYDEVGNQWGSMYGTTPDNTYVYTIELDAVAPVMEAVTPAEGALFFGSEDTFVLTVDAGDDNLYELEIDHSLSASLPEFSVYADALNPWGTLEDKAQFEGAGVTVAYDDVEQVWTIDFGADITDAFIANGGITFYMVLTDMVGNQWGTMYGTTPDNTYVYTITLDDVAPIMEEVLPAEGALLFGPDDTLVLTVDAADLNLYELEIDHSLWASLPEFSVYADALNPWGTPEDQAAFTAAGVTVAYDDVEQIWTIDFGPNVTNAFVNNGRITFYMVLKDLAGNTWGSMSPTTDANTYVYTIELDAVAPVIESVAPEEGLVTLGLDETFVLIVDALDLNLYELEIDHSFEGTLPEFSVYASEATPWGTQADKDMFDAAGVTIGYDADLQQWTIDFGEGITDNYFIPNGVTFYMVLIDEVGNTWGSMSPPTGDNTFAYTFEVTNTLEPEITSAVTYAYTPVYEYVGDIAFDDPNNIFTATYSPAEFLAGGAMNDLARYLGALYRQDGATVISIVYDGVTYTWDETGLLKGSNWEDASGNTLVSAMVADYLAAPGDLVITVGDGWHTSEVTFKLVVTNTIEEEIASAPLYIYADGYVYVGDSVFDDPINTYTNTYTPAEFVAEGGMNDLARYLGALYRQDLSTIISIVYDGVTYTWDETGLLKGSNWEDASGNTLVSAMVADYLAAPGDLVITVSDGWHTSNVTFRLLITNTLDDEIESAPSYVYTDYTYVGTRVFDDATNIYTVTYDDVDFNPNAMYDLARYLGALYRQDGATVISIVYGGETYTWDETGTLKGSNWEDASGNTLVSKIVDDFEAGLINPVVGVVLTVSDGVHTENVTFKFVILDTIAPEFVSGVAMGATGFDPVTAVDLTFTVPQGYTIDHIEFTMSETVLISVSPYVYIDGVLYGRMSAIGNLVKITPYEGKEVAGIPGTFTFTIAEGAVTDSAGNPWVHGPVTLVVVDETAPTIASGVAKSVSDGNVDLVDGAFTVDQGYVVDTIDITMTEDVLVDLGTVVTMVGYGPYGTITANVDGVITITPTAGYETAALIGTFTFTVPDGSITDLAGNPFTESIVLNVLEVVGTISWEGTGGVTPTIVGDTVTFDGEIAYYTTEDGPPTNGHWVGVQIDAPAGYDTVDTTFTINGGTPYTWDTVVDGDNYVWIYKLVSTIPQTTSIVVNWNAVSVQTFTIEVTETSTFELENSLAWLQANTVLSSVSGMVDDLTATFPDEIPAAIVAEDYVIDSRMTLAEALPAGSTVTVYKDGVAVLTDITLSGVGPFWFTELFDPDVARADFDANYGGKVEEYRIVVTGPGGNVLDFETTVFVESVISKDGFATETVLDDITLGVLIPADEAAALAWLQSNTVLSSVSGTIADLKATFPASIPPVIVAEDYVIDSRIRLSVALPEGVTVNVYREGNLILPDLVLEGTGPFWFTQLFDPDAERAAFDAGYGGAIENYSFILNGAVAFDYSSIVTVESVILKGTTETILDDIELAASIAATEAEALNYVIENTILSSVSGTIADLKATFPDHIPPIISDGLYVIDSRLTLAEALPLGTTVTVFKDGAEILTDITLNGTGPFWFTTLFDPDQPRASFDEAVYAGAIEDYVIVLTGPGDNPLDFDTTLKVESVLFKFGFATEVVLDEITLDAHIDDGVAPEMVEVLPIEGLVTLAADESFVMTVKASDPNLYELEIDHSFEGILPEFSVYADALNPWGTPEDQAQFEGAGVTVSYDADLQQWTIDFGEDITDMFIPGGVTFYMVLIDEAGNTWGSMSPPTGDNTFAYTFEVTNTLEPEITSAVTYEYTPIYEYVGVIDFDDPNNIFTATYSPAEFLAEGGMNDLARYLGALYRQDGATVINIVYDGVTYTWDETGLLKGSNWEDVSGGTLVSAMVADYLAAPGDLVITVSDGWHTSNVTFRLLITNTLDDEIESAPSYVYTDYTYVGDYAFVDATNIYTVTYDDVEFNPNAMNDLARYLGALYRQDSSTVISIVYGGETYTWDAEVGLQGSNWVDSLGNTLVSKIVDDFEAGLINPLVGLALTVSDGVHTENVTFKFVILDTIAPEVVSGVAMGATGFEPVTADATLTFTVPQGYTVDHIEITMSEAVEIVAPGIVYFEGNPYGTMSASGNVVTITPYAGNEVAGIPGTFDFSIDAGSIKDLAGNELTTLTATMVVEPSTIFGMTDFGMWGDTWPGAYNVGWQYVPLFDTTTIANLEVGMLDADRKNIVTYTAEGAQLIYQRDNGYITATKLSSAPFYRVYNGNPIVEGPDLDWTVIFGESFDGWSPRWGYVRVTDIYGTVVYHELEYTGTLGDLTAPTIESGVAIGATGFDPVTAADLTFTVPQGYTVDHIEFTMSEPVTVVAGTEVTLAGAPYGLVTVSADGLTLTVTPYPGNTIANLLGNFIFSVPEAKIFDISGNPLETLSATMIVTDQTAPEILSGVAKSVSDGNVDLVDGAFTVDQGYVVDTIDITMTEPVLVDLGTVVTMVGYGPYGTVTAHDGALITITPTAGYETAALIGTFTFTVPDGSITDLAGNPFTESIVLNVLEVVGTISWEGTGGVTPTIVGDAVTFDGEIAYYTTVDGPPTNGHWVGVQIDAPAGYDTVDTTFTINGGTPYTWDAVVDGDNFVWIYKLVSTIPQTTSIVVNWNAVSVQTFTIEVTETSTFELENSLAYLQANTVLSSVSGMVDDLTATFPDEIPAAIVAEDYVIDSRMTLAEALPAGTTVTVYKDGVAVLTDITLSGVGPFWFTELFDPDLPRADFDANYGGKVEDYVIVVTGPAGLSADFDTTVLIESVISKDGFTNETVLDDITLGIHLDDAVAPEIESGVARSASHGDVNLIDGKFTVDQGFVVDAIEVTMDEPVLVDIGTIVTMEGYGPYGTITANVDGVITITPYAGYETAALIGTFTFTVPDGSITDLRGNEFVGNIILNVLNVAPVAMDDTYTTDEDVALTVPARGVLANDTDFDPAILTAVMVSEPANGTLVLNADGSFTYTPDNDFFGTDTFTYKANDGELDSNVATVTITVTDFKDQVIAVDDEYETDEDTMLTIAAPGVLANDIDVDLNMMTAGLVRNVEHGTLTLNGDGSFTYDPDPDFHGTDSFEYQLVTYPAPQSLWTDEATVTITVNPVGDAPVLGLMEDATIPELVEYSFTATATDVDLPAQALTFSLVDAPDGAVITEAGVFTWTPTEEQGPGTYTFAVMVCDDTDPIPLCDEQEVTLTVTEVNTAPVAQDLTGTTEEETLVDVTLVATDADEDVLTYAIVDQPAHGTVTLVGATATYTPELDFNGEDSFTYKANDGMADSGMAVVTITVTPVNDAPVAVDDAYTVAEKDTLTIAAPGILANDSDVDGDTLTAIQVYATYNGSLHLNPDGSFTYTPDPYFNGTDSFAYKASDGELESELTVVTITVTPVNDWPIANDDFYEVVTGNELVKDAAEGILANDVLLDPDEEVSIQILEGPHHGTLNMNDDGSFTYTPNAGYMGTDTFRYLVLSVQINAEWSDDATVTITVQPYMRLFLPLILR